VRRLPSAATILQILEFAPTQRLLRCASCDFIVIKIYISTLLSK